MTAAETMNRLSSATVRPFRLVAARWARLNAKAVGGLLLSLVSLGAAAQTPLADEPLYATGNPPGNMALALSVEYPTAISIAHARPTYVSATEYLGYFDPDKCYTYQFKTADTPASPNATALTYFVPASLATAHACSGKWSGNFLNWAMMQTIDTFRWVMTGGYRVVDDADKTVLEKAWGSNQGGVFPDSTITGTDIAGATPFGSTGATQFKTRIFGLGNRMRFALSVSGPATYQVDYFDNYDLTGAPKFSRTETGTDAVIGNASPAPGIPATFWSSRYKTSITIPAKGSYIFQTSADDGARMYLDGTMVINDWPVDGHAKVSTNAPARMYNAGDVVQLIVEYRQRTGGASLKINWQIPGSSTFSEVGIYSIADLASTPTTYDATGTPAKDTVYDVFTRVKVCDSGVSLESNCKAYSGSAKPEGLMQQYKDKLRFSVFGYLNDSNKQRDAGVLRARQKFIGPTKPVYGATAVRNTAGEWDPDTGIFTRSPDELDDEVKGTTILDSGAMNYVNKFGELTRGNYKGNDPVSELFYAVVRYYRNIGDVDEWWKGATSTALDGFPVFKQWDDPILYTCQKNFILGIGDVNTHADKNLPGNTNGASEPALPDAVAKDPSQYLPYDQRFTTGPGPGSNALTPFTSTNRVGAIELASGGSYYGSTSPLGQVSPINGSFGDVNSALMAGLAYDIHTTGIRPFDPSKGQVAQTVDTYWVDVLENGDYRPTNQFWLAAKYGGFDIPSGFKPYASTVPVFTDAMWTNGDLIGAKGVLEKRPRNYFSGGDPATMRKGLIAAFADAGSKAEALYSTSLATPSPQVGSTGTASYGATYAAKDWSGELVGNSVTFDSLSGTPKLIQRWLLNERLTAQGSAGRRIVTWNGSSGVPFVKGATTADPGITGAQAAALKTTGPDGADDSTNYLNYLRGDRSLEISPTVTDPTRVYRTRNGLLGDIVNSKPTAVGPPSFPYDDATNAGYSSFRSDNAGRRTVVYVGANDGMLHAVNGALLKTSDPAVSPEVERDDNAPGKEIFAYVPAALFNGPNIPATATGTATAAPTVNGLASLGKPSFVHHYMVDATPSSYDVDFFNTAGPVAKAPDWRTILVGGLGKGGRSYYALDITRPQDMTSEAAVATKVLWEYKNDDLLGFTYGEPIVAKTKRYGWVVVLPSGYNNRDGKGHLIVLNARTGALLQDIDLGTDANGLAHANTFIVDSTDGTADSIYAGDLGGNVWRVDLTSPTTDKFPSVRLATLIDSSKIPQPITVRPTLKVDPTDNARRRFVMFGTGRLLDKSDLASTQVQSFYALLDGSQSAFNASATNGVNFPITRGGLANVTATLAGDAPVDLTTKAGYYFDLASDSSQGTATSRVTSEASTFYSSVAFSTSQPKVDICSPSGTSNLYGLDFGKANSFLSNTTGTVSYFSYATTATDVLFFSNAGTATLNIGFSTGTPIAVPPIKPSLLIPRRVNWREVPAVE